jgi:branched-chain amino acid transport system permease protein
MNKVDGAAVMDQIYFLVELLLGVFIAGSIYSLIAMGLSLLWSTVGLANFAHGAILVVGSYIAWYFSSLTGVPLLMFLTVPIMFLIGALFDKSIFRQVRYKEDSGLRLILITITLALVIEQILNIIFGGIRRRIPTLLPGEINLGNAIIISNQYILVFIVASVTLIVLYFILTRTITGIAIRAIGQNMQESLLVGINVERIYTTTVGIGFALAGIAGALLGSIYIFNASFGRMPLLIGYIIVVLGGVGNLKGTIYASYLIATIEAFTTFYIGGSWRIAIPFLVMILILLIRPYGLFGTKEATR